MHAHPRRLSFALVALTTALALQACNASPGAPESTAPPVAPAPSAPAEQVAPAPPAPAEAEEPKILAELGKPAPDFTLTDIAGTSHTLSSYAGKTVVLEWFNPDCPFVKGAYQSVLAGMAERLAREDLVWLTINSGAPGKQGHGLERNKQASEEHGFKHPVLLDETGKVGKTYGAARTPHMYVIDAKGVLVYRGGIDNAPMGTVDGDRPRLPDSAAGAHVNYVEAALEDLAAGRPLRLPDTPPYGCSVKYES